jgi:hypothetical protein
MENRKIWETGAQNGEESDFKKLESRMVNREVWETGMQNGSLKGYKNEKCEEESCICMAFFWTTAGGQWKWEEVSPAPER